MTQTQLIKETLKEFENELTKEKKIFRPICNVVKELCSDEEFEIFKSSTRNELFKLVINNPLIFDNSRLQYAIKCRNLSSIEETEGLIWFTLNEKNHHLRIKLLKLWLKIYDN
jgi:hypothetical protein